MTAYSLYNRVSPDRGVGTQLYRMYDRRILDRPHRWGRINLSKQIAEEQETWKKKKEGFMHDIVRELVFRKNIALSLSDLRRSCFATLLLGRNLRLARFCLSFGRTARAVPGLQKYDFKKSLHNPNGSLRHEN